MRRRALLTSAARATLAAVSTILLAGCSNANSESDSPDEQSPDSTESPEPSATPTPTPEPTPATVSVEDADALDVTAHELDRRNAGTDSELVAVAATVENVGDDAVTDVVALARFLDADGDVLGENSVEASRVSAGGTWEFEITFPDTGDAAAAVADYRLVIRRQA